MLREGTGDVWGITQMSTSISFAAFRQMSFDDAARLATRRNEPLVGQVGGPTVQHANRTTHTPADIEAFDTLRRMSLQQHLPYRLPPPTTTVRMNPHTVQGSNHRSNRHPLPASVGRDQQQAGARGPRRDDHVPAAAGGGGGDESDSMTYEELLQLDENKVSKGINESTQKRILKRVHKQQLVGAKGKEPCAVCQEALAAESTGSAGRGAPQRGQQERPVVQLPSCSHCFHEECISPWLKMDRTCPICRAEVHPTADR
jgi:hypothetical protein